MERKHQKELLDWRQQILRTTKNIVLIGSQCVTEHT